MKVLLCLLSQQHVPNLLSVHHFLPDRLVLIESEQMQKQSIARHFLEALKFGGLDYSKNDRCLVQPLPAEDDLSEVRRVLQTTYGKFPSGLWIANLTGGTKPMSIATYEFFKAVGGRLIYTNASKPARIIDMVDGSTEMCGYRPGIREFLGGYGFDILKKIEKITEGEERAKKKWSESATLLAQHAEPTGILKLKEDERNRARKKGIELQKDRFRFPCKRLWELWLGNRDTQKLDEYEVQFLTGGWLEVFVWHLLQRHAEALGIWDVRLGLAIGRTKPRSENDIDVAFMHNHALSMVECKTGSQQHDKDGDVLYKFEAVTKQFRALRVRSYLVTTSDNLDDGQGAVKEHIKTRADIYGCRILRRDEIQQLAHNVEDVDTVRKLFFQNRPSE